MKSNSSKRSSNIWMILVLIAPAVVLSGTIFAYVQAQKNSNSEAALETSTIGTGDIILYATGIGSLTDEEVSFGFRNDGKVSEVLVGLGDQVEAGQVLARLESDRLQLRYKQAKARFEALSSASTIAAAKQALAEAQQSFDIARDDLQYLIGPEMLLAEEQVTKAQEEVAAVTAEVKRDPSQANKKKVSEAEAALTAAQETLDYAYYNYSNSYSLTTFTFPVRNDKGTTIRREYKPPTEAELLAGQAAYELAKANLEDAQNYLAVLLGKKTVEEVPASSVTAITEARNALDSAEADLTATELIAPMSGTITFLNLSAGENIGTSAVVTMTKINQPYVIDASLDETDWDTAKVGYAATVTFDLLPEEEYSGQVIQVYPALDDSSDISMIRVLVQLDHSISLDIPAGSTASVDVTGGEALNVVLVPTTALKEVERGKYFVFVMENGEPVEQEIEIGLQDILYAEVKSGLKSGDVVLSDATTMGQ